MDSYLYTVDLPFSGVQLTYRDISSKEQLLLAKANVVLPASENNYLEYSNIVKKTITKCIENKEDFNKLNIIDYVLFLLKIRIISVGDQLELQFNTQDEKTKEKVTIDLNVVMRNVYDLTVEATNNNIIYHNNITILVDFPNILSEHILLNNTKNNIEHIFETVPEYIKTITVDDSVIDLSKFTSKEKIQMYESLPISIRSKIQQNVLEMIKILASKNVFSIPRLDYFRFNFYNKSLQEFIRLIFSSDLRNIYQEYYILASKKIDPAYVDNLSILERKVFISFIEEEIESRKNTQSNDGIPIGGAGNSDLQGLIDEFGG
jgi:hypothetical protein